MPEADPHPLIHEKGQVVRQWADQFANGINQAGFDFPYRAAETTIDDGNSTVRLRLAVFDEEVSPPYFEVGVEYAVDGTVVYDGRLADAPDALLITFFPALVAFAQEWINVVKAVKEAAVAAIEDGTFGKTNDLAGTTYQQFNDLVGAPYPPTKGGGS